MWHYFTIVVTAKFLDAHVAFVWRSAFEIRFELLDGGREGGLNRFSIELLQHPF